MDAKNEILEVLEFWKYKVANNLCTPEEMESLSKMLQENMDMYGTVEDFAKFFDVSETQIRTTINRKMIDKPKRRVYYRFMSFLKIIPKSWRDKRK